MHFLGCLCGFLFIQVTVQASEGHLAKTNRSCPFLTSRRDEYCKDLEIDDARALSY